MASSVAPITIPRTASPTPLEDRHSQISTSATSYLTAPQSAQLSHSSPSRSSVSVHTIPASPLPRDPDPLNPIHALSLGVPSKSQSQEFHIVQLTDDSVHLQSGSVPDTLLHKVGHSIVTVVSDHSSERRIDNRSNSADSSVGPSTPSPPPHLEHNALHHQDDDQMSRTQSSPSIRPVTFDDSTMRDRQPSSSSRHYPKFPSASSRLPPSLSHRTSSDTKASIRTVTPSMTSPRMSRMSVQSDSPPASDFPFTEEPDGFLHPPPATPTKPSRRNTTGSASTLPTPKASRMATMQSFPHSQDMGDGDATAEIGELDSDIQLQAEQIRRERISKRQKAIAEAEKVRAEQEAEKNLARSTSLVRGHSQRDERPLVGNLIGEDHVNYVLMYNMLTGIRIAVSRCQAKIRRELTDEDFTACHKYSFDIVGNELTPSAKYDFKFKDYSPWVFRDLREDYFHLDPADYLLSLTAKYILSELGSPGKSGSFFYFSRDYRFIIKTIHHSEHKFLRSILKKYYEHVKHNPHTLLSRFYGLHRVKLPHGRKIHFVIMNNLFPAHKDIHETYDLKGSTVGREYPEDKASKNPRAVLKDLNWINRGKTLELGPEKRALLTEQLRRDSELLKQLHVMDYSLLVGIHNMERGNRDNVRSNTLKVFSPEMPLIRRKHTQSKGASSPDAIAMRRIMRESDPQKLGVAVQLPDSDTGERQHFLFYQDDGGLRATNERNGDLDVIYYLGVIDILTPYTSFKKIEHFWKGLQADRHKISPVPPFEYGDRFFSFMKAIMRGGEGGARFKAE